MKNLILSTIIIIACSVFYSCNEESTTGTPPAVDDFPNSRGTTWDYKMTDSLSNTSQDFKVLVGGKTNLVSGEEVTVWQLSFPDTVDSNYVLIKKDTVKILENKENSILNIKLVFPLKLGSGWRGDYVTDTFYVASINQVAVPAGNFNNVYVIERYYGGFNEYDRMTIWFVPGVGIIKLYKRDVGLNFQNETRELTAYHIE